MIYIVLIICIISIVGFILFTNYNNCNEKMSFTNQKIKEARKNIKISLEKKENLLESSIEIIKNGNKKKYAKKEILENLIKNKNHKLTFQEKYEELLKLYNEFNEIIEDDQKALKNKQLIEIIYSLKENENDLNATINFYNNSILEMNNIKKNVFANFIFKKNDFKNYQSINIIKNEQYAILKEDK